MDLGRPRGESLGLGASGKAANARGAVFLRETQGLGFRVWGLGLRV